jgi:hypothetical protein
MKKSTVRLNFEFPREEYPQLKLICAELGVSFREFATDLFLNAIEEYEDKQLAKLARKRIKEMDPNENISFEEAVKLANWKESD